MVPGPSTSHRRKYGVGEGVGRESPPGLGILEYEASLWGDQLEKSPLLLPPPAATQTVLAAAGTFPKGTGCHPGLLGPEVMPGELLTQ